MCLPISLNPSQSYSPCYALQCIQTCHTRSASIFSLLTSVLKRKIALWQCSSRVFLIGCISIFQCQIDFNLCLFNRGQWRDLLQLALFGWINAVLSFQCSCVRNNKLKSLSFNGTTQLIENNVLYEDVNRD